MTISTDAGIWMIVLIRTHSGIFAGIQIRIRNRMLSTCAGPCIENPSKNIFFQMILITEYNWYGIFNTWTWIGWRKVSVWKCTLYPLQYMAFDFLHSLPGRLLKGGTVIWYIVSGRIINIFSWKKPFVRTSYKRSPLAVYKRTLRWVRIVVHRFLWL